MMHDIPDLDVEAVTQFGHQAPVPQQEQARQDQVRPGIEVVQAQRVVGISSSLRSQR